MLSHETVPPAMKSVNAKLPLNFSKKKTFSLPQDPKFSQPRYAAEIVEDSPPGTPVATVLAADGDEGDFGLVRYHLSGPHSAAFRVDPSGGEVTVADPSVLDREEREFVTLQVGFFYCFHIFILIFLCVSCHEWQGVKAVLTSSFARSQVEFFFACFSSRFSR